MKKLTTPRQLLTAICLLFSLLFSPNTKAQDDPNCGFVADGILVDSITSWSIKEMSVVYPIKQSWKKYDFIQCVVWGGNLGLGHFQLKPADLADYADAKYAVYNFINNTAKSGIQNGGETESYCANCKEGSGIKTKPDPNYSPKIYFILRGHNITSYVEYLDSYGRAVKEPRYANGLKPEQWEDLSKCGDLLYETKHIPYKVCNCFYDKATYKSLVKKAEKEGNWPSYYIGKCDECKVDYSKIAVQPGKKFNFQIERVDLNGKFGKVKGGNSSNAEVKTNTTTTKPTDKKNTTTSKTSGGNPTKTDPNLVPYVEKWDNGKIKIQGQKNKDDELQGTWKYYDESGKLIKTEEYKDNELISTKEN